MLVPSLVVSKHGSTSTFEEMSVLMIFVTDITPNKSMIHFTQVYARQMLHMISIVLFKCGVINP